MKKSLLALAVLGAFAGVASAQSSVTLYGLVDANFGKDNGSAQKRMSQGASSRLGFRGVEDLGGGSSAFFQLENRFRPWNGTINGGNGVNGSPVTLFQARSYVGIRGGWGDVRLGREYDAAFFHGELMGDIWGWDTVASNLSVSVMAGTAVNNFNVNRAVTYTSPNMGGFSFTAQIAETNDNCGASGLNGAASSSTGTAGATVSPVAKSINGGATFGACAERPRSAGLSYAAGPFRLGVGYNNPGNVNDYWVSTNAQYDMGVVKLSGFYGTGKNTLDQSVKSAYLAAAVPMGQAEFRAAVMNLKSNDVTTISGFALGYHYSLSKRTVLYADVSRNTKAATEPNGYDFGVKHAF